MPRIRTIKPEFFRHGELQDLEKEHPGFYPMLVFAALFGHCDKNGVFLWDERQLALDILPFLWRGHTGDTLGKSLGILRDAGFVSLATADSQPKKRFGIIPTFPEHQRITGKEGQAPSKYPPLESLKVAGHTGDTPETHPGVQEVELGSGSGSGREGKEEPKPLVANAIRLATTLADRILENNPNHTRISTGNGKREITIRTWADAIEKLNRLDGQPWEEIESVISWCQRDEFWRQNILSGATLRKKYDQLRPKALRVKRTREERIF
jgi:hypothetical protein